MPEKKNEVTTVKPVKKKADKLDVIMRMYNSFSLKELLKAEKYAVSTRKK